ncbi:MAG TPA: exodeoxyribonuclease VII large subunit [Vicinamibacterales bacterium]|jgi:exodeoxyribonuclease VII large subunit|nr:exodeoxyribonuclease VII large subunit [Vicinamibacterales bacterium]
MADLFDMPFEEGDRWPPDDDLLPEPPRRAPVERRTVTVSALTSAIRRQLETGFGDLWVEGEISNCRLWNTGILYFTLKDDGAQIKAVMFRTAVRYLRFTPEDGLHVVARGRLGVYEPKGEYQLVCEHIEPHGLGALQLAFEQLKSRLQAEGLFAADRKRPLPAFPKRIGIVTSLEGAAVRDILKVLRRRAPNASVLIRPARVQGDGAADEIARALKALARVGDVDVVIVGRGGGSAEDLWAFNEERVARMIAASPVPVITGIGHEVDFTIADFVADVRAPTPSAAAEMVVATTNEFCTRIDRLSARLRAAVGADVQRRRAYVHTLGSRRGLSGVQTRVAMRGRHTAELDHQLRVAVLAAVNGRARRWMALRQRLEQRDLARRLAVVRTRLTEIGARLEASARRTHHRAHASLQALSGRLDNLSPLAVLARGYAVCWTENKERILRRAADAAEGDHVSVTLAEGELACRVERLQR